MIHSMTGFASKTFILTAPSGERCNITVSLKSLNSRFFESTVRLPSGLSHLETTIIKLLKEKLRRGHVYFTAHLSNSSIFEGSINPALSTVKAYAHAIEEIRTALSISEPIKLDNILRIPGIFSTETQELDETSTATILSAIEELISKVILDRQLEGANLKIDLTDRITIITKEMHSIKERAQTVVQEYKKKVHATLQELGQQDNLMADAQKSSLYGMLDKIDIHEEITRFASHLSLVMNIIESPDIEKGKKLDFTLQELGREINTIASKCSDATISTHAINVKVEIEKIREQIQNIV